MGATAESCRNATAKRLCASSVLRDFIFPILAAGFFTTSLSASGVRTFHLSPDGDDRAAGAADAPLASLAGARDAIRRARTEDNHAGPVRVIVADGRYPLREPVVFEARDGGGPDAAETYAAAPGAMPVFDAGQPLSGWTVEDDGSWSSRLPAGAPETLEALWVNDRRAVRARFPTSGEALLEGVTETILEAGGGRLPETAHQELRLPPEAFEVLAPLDAAQLAAVDIILYHKWDVTRRRALALDAATRTAIVEGRGMKPWNRLDQGIPFILENLPGPPATPGE